jgi:aspartate/tyrosine/aromatic aminotransferase
MREELVDKVEKWSGVDWSRIRGQKGFFAWTGLTGKQVERLHSEGVFMLLNGRMNVAGLNAKNIDFVSEKVGAALKQ